MKAATNGVVNVSVLDGWWDEAFAPDMGFAIGSGEAYSDLEMQDEIESRAIYDIIERHAIPEFFDFVLKNDLDSPGFYSLSVGECGCRGWRFVPALH